MDRRSSSGKTETRGITALRIEIDKHDRINIEAPDAGKTPAWDGHIYVYSSSSHTNENLLGRIPIQVKGISVKSFHNGTRSFPVLPAHLLSYKSEFGTLFIVVEIHEKTKLTKLFYASLLPYDISSYLENKTEGKKKINIELKEYIANDVNDLDLICRNFLRQRDMQAGKKPVNINDLVGIDKFEFTVVAKPGKVIDYLFTESSFLYAVDKNETKHLLEKFETVKIASTYEGTVSIADKVYYSKIQFESDREGNKDIRVGKNIVLGADKVQFRLEPKDDIAEQINDAEFFIAAVKNKGFNIDDKPYRFDPDCTDGSYAFFDVVEEHLEHLYNFQFALNFLGIYELGKPNDYVDNEIAFIHFLIDTKIHQKDVKCPLTLANGFISFPLRGKKIQLLYYNGKIWNVFSREYSSEIHFTVTDASGIVEEASPYCNENPRALIRSDNFDQELVLESVSRFPITDLTSGRYNELLLAALREYDDNPMRNDYYEFAFQLAHLLLKHSNNEVNQLNLFQTIKRKRVLLEEEIEALENIVVETVHNFSKCGALILLDRIQDSLNILSQLSEQERGAFQKFPIYNFIRQQSV